MSGLWIYKSTCCLPNLSAGDIATLQRGTPLYGQPSWWGDGDADDENSLKHDAKASEQKQARCEAGKIHCCHVNNWLHERHPLMLCVHAGSKDTVIKQQMGPGITTQNLGKTKRNIFFYY